MFSLSFGWTLVRPSALALALTATASPALLAAETSSRPAGTAAAASSAPDEAVSFSEAYLSDAVNIEAGKTLWQSQCRHCHGRSAYPGKAPKLKPRRYTADFVYHRVTFGFRKMPAWESIYNLEERKALVAYVLSGDFSP